MFNDITIIIPTMGRLYNQKTLGILSPELLSRTILIVAEDEFQDHAEEYGLDCEVVALPWDVCGMGSIRQYAVEICKTPYLFLIDDDMILFKRDLHSVKLHHCTQVEQYELFETLRDWLEYDGLPLVGISARQGNNHVTQGYIEATRQTGIHGINVAEFNHLGLRFDKSELMEDLHLVLSLLTQGIMNRVTYQFCWNQAASGSIGGCSTYRTPELQKQCAEQLAEEYPDFVTLVEKKSKTGWKGLETRTDVRVQWKKAYQYGLSKC